MDDLTRAYHLKLIRLEEVEKSRRHTAFMNEWMNKGYEEHSKNIKERKDNQIQYDYIKN